MNLYLRILSIIAVYWKHLIALLFLTVLYVIFNNLSLWISVDFVQELFTPDKMVNQQEKQPNGLNGLIPKQQVSGIYKKIEKDIKSVLIRDSKKETLLVVCLAIFVTFVLKNIIHYLRRITIAFIELKLTIELRERIHNSLLKLPLRFYDTHHTGRLTSIVFNDVGAINSVFQTSFGNLILAPIQIAANLFILFSISWKLSLAALTIIPVSAVILVKIGESMRRRSRRMMEQNAIVVSVFQEAMAGIRIIKAFTNEIKEFLKFKQANIGYFNKNYRQRKLNSATSPINEVVYITLIVGLLYYGGNLVFSHSGLSAGDFLRFLIFLFMMIQPIKDLSGVNNTIQTGMAAAERVFALVDERGEEYNEEDGEKFTAIQRDITYENVGFVYNADDGYVLKNVNLTIRRGEMVAFVGPSGAGKTTLINLLPRFYEVTEGSIKIDGVDIRRFNLKSLRAKMSIVTQDTILFNDTIRYNIAYGLDEVKEEDIIHAAKVANAWEFIEKMDEGLDTHIGERGVRLSGGQKQRISIARAILKNPPILILDEATSALDTESERLVQEAIDNLLKDRTVLVIAHRLSTIKNATKIVVMNKGQVEAVGRHEELMRKSGVYKNLYENQIIVTNSVS